MGDPQFTLFCENQDPLKFQGIISLSNKTIQFHNVHVIFKRNFLLILKKIWHKNLNFEVMIKR